MHSQRNTGKSFSDAASAPKHPVQAETGATTTDDARTRDGPSRASFARDAQRALMLRQGDGRSGDAMDCRRATAMRRIDRRFAAVRIAIPSGARGPAVAYAEDRTRVLREGGSSVGESACASMRSPVRIRSAHRWIAQSGRASVRRRVSRVQLPLQPLLVTQSCTPGRKPQTRNRSVPMRSLSKFRPTRGTRKQRIRCRGRTCREDAASPGCPAFAQFAGTPSPPGARILRTGSVRGDSTYSSRRSRTSRHTDDARCVQGRRNAPPFNAPGRPDPAARTRFFPDRMHRQTQGGYPC